MNAWQLASKAAIAGRRLPNGERHDTIVAAALLIGFVRGYRVRELISRRRRAEYDCQVAPAIVRVAAWYRADRQYGAFTDDSGYLVIFPPCSSVANASLAFLCWVTVTELSGHRRGLSDLWWCLLSCSSVVAINVGRVSMMGISLQHYEAIHSQIGDALTNVMILIVTRGWSFLGAKREL